MRLASFLIRGHATSRVSASVDWAERLRCVSETEHGGFMPACDRSDDRREEVSSCEHTTLYLRGGVPL